MPQKDQKSLNSLQDENNKEECPDCKNKEIEYENNERFCKKCGYVFE